MSAREIEIDTTQFDAGDRPPAGTACLLCKGRGHFCPAKGYAGESPLCMACGAGEACEQLAAVERMAAGIGEWDFDQVDPRGLSAPCRSIAITDADREAATAPAVSAWRAKANLSAENLKPGQRSRAPKWKSDVKPKRVRNAGRRKRMTEEVMQEAERVQSVVAEIAAKPIVEDKPVTRANCGRGCGRPIHRGHCVGSNRAKPKAAKPVKRVVALVKPVVAQPVDAEIVSIRVPVQAMDRLFQMLHDDQDGSRREAADGARRRMNWPVQPLGRMCQARERSVSRASCRGTAAARPPSALRFRSARHAR